VKIKSALKIILATLAFIFSLVQYTLFFGGGQYHICRIIYSLLLYPKNISGEYRLNSE